MTKKTKKKKKQHQTKAPAQTQGPASPPGSQVQGSQFKTDESIVQQSEDEAQLIEQIQKERNSKLLIFICGEAVRIKDDVSLQAFELLKELGKVERLDMILNSRGGQTEVPGKLVPLIRNYCDFFGVLVPFQAHSAATHIAIGANEIVMGPMSELSPVDPSRQHPLLPKDKDGNPIPISVQDLKHVMDLLKREGPEESYTPEALATIFSGMFEYVHPLAMGAIEQSYALAKLISAKLLSTHMDPEQDGEKIEKIASELSDGFKSHQYLIGWQEAKSLGLPITFDDGKLYRLMWELYEAVGIKLNEPPVAQPGDKLTTRPIVVMATEKSRRVLFELSQVEQEGPLSKFKPVGAHWVSSGDLKASAGPQTDPA